MVVLGVMVLLQSVESGAHRCVPEELNQSVLLKREI